MKNLEIPNAVQIVSGNGGLPKVVVTTKFSAAEIYLHGATITHFQKNGEAAMIFLSSKSHFKGHEAIRGGVPICFPWFGNRDGEPSHGFARLAEWQLVKTTALSNGAVTLTFALPQVPGREAWKNLRTEFIVTVADTLTMALTTANEACGETLEIENCLHTYFHIGNVDAIHLTGLQGAPYDDFAFGANGAPRSPETAPLRFTQETNRVYPHNTSAVQIHDEKLKRIIRVEKSDSNSTVVWNPWTTQKMPADWDINDYLNMVCVESGNVKQNKISLAPGKTAALKVVLSSEPLK